MLTKRHGNNFLRDGVPDLPPVPEASEQLEKDGYAHLKAVLSAEEVASLRAECDEVFASSDVDRERDVNDEWRYAMFNRSPLCQQTISHRAILDVIEPLLGEDCHVMANTLWRNVKGHAGGGWHIDAGPHIPRPADVPWDDRIPYPVFAIGTHIYLEDCPLEAGPTAVVPGSHRSGQFPPYEKLNDLALTYDGRASVTLPAKAGDVVLFVSDVWHRGTPAQDGFGRYFLQCHYGRRDIAQRVLPTSDANHVSDEAKTRANAADDSTRARALIGLHPIHFYDG